VLYHVLSIERQTHDLPTATTSAIATTSATATANTSAIATTTVTAIATATATAIATAEKKSVSLSLTKQRSSYYFTICSDRRSLFTGFDFSLKKLRIACVRIDDDRGI